MSSTNFPACYWNGTTALFTLGFKPCPERASHKSKAGRDTSPFSDIHRLCIVHLLGVHACAQISIQAASLPLECQRSLCIVTLKMLSLQPYLFIFSCTSIKRWHAVTRTTTASCINDVFSCYVRVWDASGRINVYATKGMWSDVSQTTSASGLSDCVFNASWGSIILVFSAD